MRGIIFLLATLAMVASQEDAKLVRVVVLARHGNRAPNAQVPTLCPNLADYIMPRYGVPLAALSKVGMAENWENGVYLRKKYIPSFLPDAPYQMDGSTSFFAERMGRNIVATYVLTQGMYPEGTGMQGFRPDRPNLIPIPTTQELKDELMNNPRDGPCRWMYKKDFAKWSEANDDRVFAENKDLIQRISKACGGEGIRAGVHFTPRDPSRPHEKYLAWATKAVADAFSFSLNEGIDATMEGKVPMEDIMALKKLSTYMINGTRFGKEHQMTYWVSNFLPNLFLLAQHEHGDKIWLQQRFHLFLNHRELMLATAHILQIPIPQEWNGALIPGCSLTFEMYEDKKGEMFFKFIWWGPTRPDAKAKSEAVKKGDLTALFTGGQEIYTAPAGCKVGGLCPLSLIVKRFDAFVAETGTYQEICNIPGKPKKKGSFEAYNADALDPESDVLTPSSFGAGSFVMMSLIFAAAAFIVWKVAELRKRAQYNEIPVV